MRIQRRDKMFAAGARSCFRLPGRKNRCSKLMGSHQQSTVPDRSMGLSISASIPHPNQSAYRKGVSCGNSIFSTQEVICGVVAMVMVLV